MFQSCKKLNQKLIQNSRILQDQPAQTVVSVVTAAETNTVVAAATEVKEDMVEETNMVQEVVMDLVEEDMDPAEVEEMITDVMIDVVTIDEVVVRQEVMMVTRSDTPHTRLTFSNILLIYLL